MEKNRKEASSGLQAEPTAEPGRREWAQDGIGDGLKLTAAQGRRHFAAITAVLTAFAELVNALETVVGARPADVPAQDEGWWEDAEALHYFAALFYSGWAGMTTGPVIKASDAEYRRRRDAFDRGETHHSCCVLWADRAIEAAKEVLDRHGKYLVGHTFGPNLAEDAARQLWLLTSTAATWQGEAYRHMNAEARREAMRTMTAEAEVAD